MPVCVAGIFRRLILRPAALDPVTLHRLRLFFFMAHLEFPMVRKGKDEVRALTRSPARRVAGGKKLATRSFRLALQRCLGGDGCERLSLRSGLTDASAPTTFGLCGRRSTLTARQQSSKGDRPALSSSKLPTMAALRLPGQPS